MKEHRDGLENLMKEGFEHLAEEEMEKIEKDESLDDIPEALKASLRHRIDERFAEENGTEKENTVTVHPKKRRVRLSLVLAAALILMLAVGMTSVGESVNVVKFLKGKVADREVEKTTATSEDNLVIVEENEEEAYQAVSDAFGIETVRIMGRPKGMVFEGMELDKTMQTAWMTYDYNGKKIRYIINTTYVDSAWSLDMEDEVTDEYFIEQRYFTVDVKEYRTPETDTVRYSAKYTYNGLEYYLYGTIEREEFENVIKNLYF